MQVGDKVTRYLTTFLSTERNTSKDKTNQMVGVVVYIQPKKRFHPVEFEVRGVRIKESFQGV